MHFVTSLICKIFLVVLALHHLGVLNVEGNDQKDLMVLKVPPRFGKRGDAGYSKDAFKHSVDGDNSQSDNYPSSEDLRIPAFALQNYICHLIQRQLVIPEQCGLMRK